MLLSKIYSTHKTKSVLEKSTSTLSNPIDLVLASAALNRCYSQRIWKTVSILEGERFSRAKRLSIIDKAIVIAYSPEHTRVYKSDRAEPSTADMNVADATL